MIDPYSNQTIGTPATNNSISSPQYDMGWVNNFKNSLASGNNLTPNQALANNAYEAFNLKYPQGSNVFNQSAYNADLNTLNTGAANATTSGAFNTVGDEIKGLARPNSAGSILGGLSTGVSIIGGINDIMNSRRAIKSAEKQLSKDNARKDELMAMNREKYNTYKADRARLAAEYKGS